MQSGYSTSSPTEYPLGIVPTLFSLRYQLPETLRLGVASLFKPVVIGNHSRLYISSLDKVLEIIRMQAEILNPQLL
jgi:hypothetical protein